MSSSRSAVAEHVELWSDGAAATDKPAPAVHFALEGVTVGHDSDEEPSYLLPKHALSHSTAQLVKAIIGKVQAVSEAQEDLRHHAEKINKHHIIRHDKRRSPKSFWMSAHEELALCVEKHGGNKRAWQVRAIRFFHDARVEMMLICLLLLDVIVVFVELFLDAEFPSCQKIRRDAVSCCSPNATHAGTLLNASSNGSHGRRLLSASAPAPAHHALCVAPLEDSPLLEAACDPHKYHTAHSVHEALFWTSVAILLIFAVELLVLIVALGLHFFRNRLYVLDFVVVGSSLGLELYLHTIDQSAGDVLVLLIFTRCWRFLRIGHGIVVSTHEMDEIAQQELHGKHEELHEQVSELTGQVHAMLQKHEQLLEIGTDFAVGTIIPQVESIAKEHELHIQQLRKSSSGQ